MLTGSSAPSGLRPDGLYHRVSPGLSTRHACGIVRTGQPCSPSALNDAGHTRIRLVRAVRGLLRIWCLVHPRL
jgi:hypothetical protein